MHASFSRNYFVYFIVILYRDSIPRCRVESFQRSTLMLADSCSAPVAFNLLDPVETQRINPVNLLREQTANSRKSSHRFRGHGMRSCWRSVQRTRVSFAKGWFEFSLDAHRIPSKSHEDVGSLVFQRRFAPRCEIDASVCRMLSSSAGVSSPIRGHMRARTYACICVCDARHRAPRLLLAG